METTDTLTPEIKRLLVENLMLRVTADEIADDQLLFGPNGLGLDSVDALQLVVALDKNYGIKIADSEVARAIFQSPRTISDAILEHRKKAGTSTSADSVPAPIS